MFNFFKKKRQIAVPENYNPVAVDMHSHLLVGIDDGCQKYEESLEIIKRLQGLGYKKLIATPHIMSDTYKNTPEIILKKRDELREELAKNNIDIEVEAAAEYYIDEWFEAEYKKNKLLTFGKNYLLVETGFMAKPMNLDQILFDLQMEGYTVILAHPERYQYIIDKPEYANELADKGILLQMNIMSLSGYYSPHIKKTAEYLIDNKLLSFVGSDIHNLRHTHVVQDFTQSDEYKMIYNSKLLNNNLLTK